MSRLIEALIKGFGVAVKYLLPLILMKIVTDKSHEADHERQQKENALDMVKSAKIRADVARDAANGNVPDKLRRFYVDGDVLPDSPADPQQPEKP